MTTSGAAGIKEYQSQDGDTWLVAHQGLLSGLSLAVAEDYTLALKPAWRAGWLGIVLSLLLGSLTAAVLTLLYQRKTLSLERVSQSVAAIAEGNLDQELLLRSSDDMRGLADNVNLVSERLRDQFAREAESRQFNSFARLSAMLAHDLKNAIEGLSLMVTNMERHFDNPQFRMEAMSALNGSTNKLRQLVTRLSTPVNTMSGDFKLPRPTDLAPLMRRVVQQIAEPMRGKLEIEINLPPSLMAMADGERVEKVMENLVLNAIEAMGDKPGKLSVDGGPWQNGKVCFSVTDTGPGMRPDFIREKLFRPFSTTKPRGVGLGLYTCREVIRANNGAIEVQSEFGSGTTFRVVLASAQIK
jgi:signal transduction histidine kinase